MRNEKKKRNKEGYKLNRETENRKKALSITF